MYGDRRGGVLYSMYILIVRWGEEKKTSVETLQSAHANKYGTAHDGAAGGEDEKDMEAKALHMGHAIQLHLLVTHPLLCWLNPRRGKQ